MDALVRDGFIAACQVELDPWFIQGQHPPSIYDATIKALPNLCGPMAGSNRISRGEPWTTLAAVDGLVIPGGESTTIDRLLRAIELAAPLRHRLQDGMPAFGSCAGMILLDNFDLPGLRDAARKGRRRATNEPLLPGVPDVTHLSR